MENTITINGVTLHIEAGLRIEVDSTGIHVSGQPLPKYGNSPFFYGTMWQLSGGTGLNPYQNQQNITSAQLQGLGNQR